MSVAFLCKINIKDFFSYVKSWKKNSKKIDSIEDTERNLLFSNKENEVPLKDLFFSVFLWKIINTFLN